MKFVVVNERLQQQRVSSIVFCITSLGSPSAIASRAR
jgi:hypothetical protein